ARGPCDRPRPAGGDRPPVAPGPDSLTESRPTAAASRGGVSARRKPDRADGSVAGGEPHAPPARTAPARAGAPAPGRLGFQPASWRRTETSPEKKLAPARSAAPLPSKSATATATAADPASNQRAADEGAVAAAREHARRAPGGGPVRRHQVEN